MLGYGGMSDRELKERLENGQVDNDATIRALVERFGADVVAEVLQTGLLRLVLAGTA